MTVTLRVLWTDLRRRIEKLQVRMLVRPRVEGTSPAVRISVPHLYRGNFDGCSIWFRHWNCATSTISAMTLGSPSP